MSGDLPEKQRGGPGARQENIELLEGAFHTFQEAALRLEQSYRELERQARAMDADPEEGDHSLKKHLVEKEQIKNYFHAIVESLSSGVIVADRTGNVTLLNRAARFLLRCGDEPAPPFPLTDMGKWASMDMEELLLSSSADRRLPMLRRFRRDGEDRYLNIEVSPLIGVGEEFQGTIIILQDVTPLKRLEAKVSRKHRVVAMGEMAENIAHTIRNPLASIELFASLLRRDLAGDAEKEKAAGQIVSCVKQLDAVISNVLLFTRNPRVKLEQTMLIRYLRESVDMVKFAMDRNRVSISYEPGHDDVSVLIDRELVRQVLFNLILNAVQVMPDGGTIVLSSAVRGEGVLVSVSDSGPGIDPASVERIFNPFFSERNRGMGLGLTIVHNIMEAHGGSVEVESVPGRGSRFTLAFPVHAGEEGTRNVQESACRR